MELDQIVSELLEATMRDGGCTVDTKTFQPSSKAAGYFVGGTVPETVIEVSEHAAKSLKLAVSAALTNGVEYLGTWVHENNIYVDGSQWITSLADAIKLGRERGELAIWDAGKAEEITL